MALANRFLKDVLGLDSATVQKVIATIKASGSGQQFQDSMIRRRIGPRAMTMIQNGMDAKSGEKSVQAKDDKKEKPDFIDADGDGNKKESMKKAQKDKEEVKEGFATLKNYLVAEAMVDVDLSDPQAAMADIRQTARIAKDPNRLQRMQQQDAIQAKKDAAETEGPTKTLRMQIARKQQELVMLNKRLRAAEKTSGGEEAMQ